MDLEVWRRSELKRNAAIKGEIMNEGENLKLASERTCCIKNWMRDKESAAR